jgi:hypothetical protein
MTAPIAIALLLVSAAVAVRRRRRSRLPAQATIISPRKSTVIAHDGAVRSVQSAVLMTPRKRLEKMWGPANLENLARTYWRFLTRVTLGLIRVVYGENERAVVLLGRPLTLLRFEAPEYVLDGDHGSVRWRISDGLLVARRGRGCGFLGLDVRREMFEGSDQATVRIELEVANFYPAIAARFSMPVYMATQSVVHVLVTHAFLRSLATLDLAESKVKRLAGPQLTAVQAVDGAPSTDGPQP